MKPDKAVVPTVCSSRGWLPCRLSSGQDLPVVAKLVNLAQNHYRQVWHWPLKPDALCISVAHGGFPPSPLLPKRKR